jgi:hypothetical protein
MELTVELTGSKPFDPKVLAEREGFDFRHLAQVMVKTRHSDNILCLCWFQALFNFGSVASHDLE